MSTRIEFSGDVKQAVAERAGYRCSFPGCLATTVGPSEESPEGSNKTGMACHIAAASGGRPARRIVSSMRPEDIASIDNAIWMCYRHGKLIDGDELRFTIPMLKAWRALAELRAQLIHELGREIELGVDHLPKLPLAENELHLPNLGEENSLIGDALNDSCVNEIWGKELGHAVRDLAIEVARNAFQHGGASEFTIVIEPTRIILIDNGGQFAVESLLSSQPRRGGSESVKQLIRRHGEQVLISSRYASGRNETVVALISDIEQVATLTPCTVRIESRELWSKRQIPVLCDCETTYIVIPLFASYSDAFELVRILSEKPHCGRRYVIVSKFISPGVADVLRDALPDCRLMVL
jgi:hypothetical protein